MKADIVGSQNRGTLPQHFVTFVEIFFAVVLGSSILEFADPLFKGDLGNPSFWALISVYITAAASWAGWHNSTNQYPYTTSKAGYLRAALDALIVVNYAFLLFWGEKVGESFSFTGNNYSLGWYLWGFVAVFILYYFSGRVRIAEYGERASKPSLIKRHGAAVLIGSLIYTVLTRLLSSRPSWVLWLFVFLPVAAMLRYRWQREWKELPRTIKVNNCSRVAVDLDGVLVEQVIPVLQKIKDETNIELTKCMITDWEYPTGKTNIKIEIEKAEREEDFIRKMPPIEGAINGMNGLSNKFGIVIATSREPLTDDWSRNWLKDHNMRYEEFVNTRSSGKILEGINILIDDYIGNIDRFVRSGDQNRQAILFAQPWNQDTKKIADLLAEGKVKIAHSWSAVLALLGCSECEVDMAKNKDDSRVKHPSEAMSRDYFILQAISCFTASFLFLRGYVVSSGGTST